MLEEEIRLPDTAWPEENETGPTEAQQVIPRTKQAKQTKAIINLSIMALVMVLVIASVLFFIEVESDEESLNFQSSPGDFSEDYLGNDYNNITVEVDIVGDLSPDPEALGHLATVLERELGKDVDIIIDEKFTSPLQVFGWDDLDDIEREHREHYRGNDSTAVIYILCVNGTFEGYPNITGLSYHGSSMALFMENIREGGTQNSSSLALEKHSLVHEAGHLLGLVEVNYQSEHQHQDPEDEYHCDHRNDTGDRDCVMMWLKDPGASSEDEIPVDFCEFCLADIEVRKG
jgi:hypothetical protein